MSYIPGWECLDDFIETDEFKKIDSFLTQQIKENKTIYPHKNDIYRALKLISFDDVKVIILGQDPYHGPNQANGLAFAVNLDVDIPPSLRNIFKELNSDGFSTPKRDLLSWAKQGVLMLNTSLTVEANKANSHKDIGWDKFTDHIISKLANSNKNVVFVLWGNNARKKKYLTKDKYVIESAHPSPLSAYNGFFGSKPFSKINTYLLDNNLNPINWSEVV